MTMRFWLAFSIIIDSLLTGPSVSNIYGENTSNERMPAF